MRANVFEYRMWSRLEVFIVLFLSAVIISETAVIFLLGHGAGDVLSRAFASAGAWGVSTLAGLWKWVYIMVGPMLLPLLILTVVEIYVLAKLVKRWRAGHMSGEPKKLYRTLGIVEGVAPGFGFLGTCLALMATMHDMDPNLTQTAMLKSLLENSSSAFGSTVYGISLAITAFLSLELFKGFLFKPEIEKEIGKQAFRKEEDAKSMNLIRRED